MRSNSPSLAKNIRRGLAGLALVATGAGSLVALPGAAGAATTAQTLVAGWNGLAEALAGLESVHPAQSPRASGAAAFPCPGGDA